MEVKDRSTVDVEGAHDTTTAYFVSCFNRGCSLLRALMGIEINSQ